MAIDPRVRVQNCPADHPRKIIRCANCKRFVAEVLITMEDPRVGPLVMIKGLKCPGCGWVDGGVNVGIGDTPDMVRQVEAELRKLKP